MTKDSKRTEKRKAVRKSIKKEITGSLAAIEYPQIELLFDQIITTVITNRVSPTGIILTANQKGIIKTRQTVVAAGKNSGVAIGQEIEINTDLFPKRKTSDAKNDIGPDGYSQFPPLVLIEGKEYLHISSRYVLWVYK